MKGLRGRRFLVAAVLILLSLLITGMQAVSAPPPPGGMPMPISEYGVVRVYGSEAFTGNARIVLTSDSMAPFFVEKVVITLNRAADFDIVLDTINIDGTGAIQVSGYTSSSRVVVISAGSVVGEVISSLPISLESLLAKDPLGNEALSVSGLAGNGLSLGIRYVPGAYNSGTTISATALIVGPTNATITMTMS